MKFDIITIFPNLFDSFLQESLLAKALKKGLIKISVHNLRKWTTDKHHKVDDRPYGGGPGMILQVGPFYSALRALKVSKVKGQVSKVKIIMLDPAGKQFDQRMAERFSKLDRVVFLCGRYEGFDNRITKFCDERISVGPYVLNGGEVPAMAMIEAIARLVPGFVGCAESLREESFSSSQSSVHSSQKRNFVEYPQYTRPEVFEMQNTPVKPRVLGKAGTKGRVQKLKVPKVLLSGDHKKIKEWREKQSGVQNIK